MHRDRSLLPELVLRLVHLTYEVDEPLPAPRHRLLRPVEEVELADGPRLPVSGVRDLLSYRFTEQVEMHVFLEVNLQ